jgi:hypothetical protein
MAILIFCITKTLVNLHFATSPTDVDIWYRWLWYKSRLTSLSNRRALEGDWSCILKQTRSAHRQSSNATERGETNCKRGILPWSTFCGKTKAGRRSRDESTTVVPAEYRSSQRKSTPTTVTGDCLSGTRSGTWTKRREGNFACKPSWQTPVDTACAVVKDKVRVGTPPMEPGVPKLRDKTVSAAPLADIDLVTKRKVWYEYENSRHNRRKPYRTQ